MRLASTPGTRAASVVGLHPICTELGHGAKFLGLVIVVIEDDENDALLLVRGLRRAGVRDIAVLSRAEEAVRYMTGEGEYSDRHKHPFPNLILLDLGLPGMSGLQFLAWLREQPLLSATPIIVLSGSPFSQDITQSYALGAKTFFTKPLDSADLDKLAEFIVRYWTSHGSAANGPQLENGRGLQPPPGV